MKLYKGMKHRQFKKNSWNYEKIIALSKYKIGDIYHDCDGFNHVLTERWLYKTRTTGGWYVNDIQLINEHGICSCGCPLIHGDISAEEINQYWISLGEDENFMDNWGTDRTKEFLELAKRGELVDSRGVRIGP